LKSNKNSRASTAKSQSFVHFKKGLSNVGLNSNKDINLSHKTTVKKAKKSFSNKLLNMSKSKRNLSMSGRSKILHDPYKNIVMSDQKIQSDKNINLHIESQSQEGKWEYKQKDQKLTLVKVNIRKVKQSVKVNYLLMIHNKLIITIIA